MFCDIWHICPIAVNLWLSHSMLCLCVSLCCIQHICSNGQVFYFMTCTWCKICEYMLEIVCDISLVWDMDFTAMVMCFSVAKTAIFSWTSIILTLSRLQNIFKIGKCTGQWNTWPLAHPVCQQNGDYAKGELAHPWVLGRSISDSHIHVHQIITCHVWKHNLSQGGRSDQTHQLDWNTILWKIRNDNWRIRWASQWGGRVRLLGGAWDHHAGQTRDTHWCSGFWKVVFIRGHWKLNACQQWECQWLPKGSFSNTHSRLTFPYKINFANFGICSISGLSLELVGWFRKQLNWSRR